MISRNPYNSVRCLAAATLLGCAALLSSSVDAKDSDLMRAHIAGSLPQGAISTVTIGNGTSVNMKCTKAPVICSPTGPNAILAVRKLETYLAAGSVTVNTGGAAGDIVINSALTWASANTLTLDSYHAITVDGRVTVTGPGGLTLVTDDGGSGGMLSFGGGDHVNFWDTASALIINNANYVLVNSVNSNANSIAALATAVANNPQGNYAFGAGYNASGDGAYPASPVATTFLGSFEGLGNTISHLSIKDQSVNAQVGLFAQWQGPWLENVNLTDEKVEGGTNSNIGGLVGAASGNSLVNDSVSGDLTADSAQSAGLLAGQAGTVNGAHASGTVTTRNTAFVGGLVGTDQVSVTNSSADVSVTARGQSAEGPVGGLCGLCAQIEYSSATGPVAGGFYIGGLVGLCGGSVTPIDHSFATGAVSQGTGLGAFVGGLCGFGQGAFDQVYATGSVTSKGTANGGLGGLFGFVEGSAISNSYATGRVRADGTSETGGLVGISDAVGGSAPITSSYSIGAVSASNKADIVGGFIGADNTDGGIGASCWDTQTSHRNQGAGNISDDPGIAGLTTAQFQSGLPSGFDPDIWGENANLNNGFPYLLAIPPQ